MPHFCCAGGCTHSSDANKNISFHSLPLNDKKRLSIWITKMKRDPKYFSITKHTKICSVHFTKNDFIDPLAKVKRLKSTSVPSRFEWTTAKCDGEEDTVGRPALTKLEACRLHDDEATDTASEGEGDVLSPGEPRLLSRKTQTVNEDCDDEVDNFPCTHAFSFSHLISKCTTAKKHEKLFTHFTGFSSEQRFLETLNFLLPNLDRKNLVYWGTKEASNRLLDMERILNDEEDANDSMGLECRPRERKIGTINNHKLPVKDEFLLVMMKLRMGLSDIDLAERFNLSQSTVSGILITWINYLYIVLGSLKIWPTREIIFQNAPRDFNQKYRNNIIILDATEINIQVPSSLQKQSETYSNYKGHTTLKCLIGVDPRGGVMFVSQLYGGSISDKEIVRRSGFLEILKQKLQTSEILPGDTIMADKGFDIDEELKELGLCLNIPPYLKEKNCFSESDVIRTQTIAMHRIHVERAICKIKRFRILHSVIPIAMMGTINQIWTVICLLSNFQNPILS